MSQHISAEVRSL